MSEDTSARRSSAQHFGSRMGFVVAAVGSAVGFGNLWKFPFMVGMQGGGQFVIAYLCCVALIGAALMIGEVVIGRLAQQSPYQAFRELVRRGVAERSWWWGAVGALCVIAAFAILSAYAVVGGWVLLYTGLSLMTLLGLRGGLPAGGSPDDYRALFEGIHLHNGSNIAGMVVFMFLTIIVVMRGVQDGIERFSSILMAAFVVLMIALFGYATTLDGFGDAWTFMWSGIAPGATTASRLSGVGVLEALGHAFFSLSLGMGAMLTYGSFLREDDDVVGTSLLITIADTAVSLLACLVIFPITFTAGLSPEAGPGLVFQAIPFALQDLPGGAFITFAFFALLVVVGLTSSIALLAVASAAARDTLGWSTERAAAICGGAITLLGIPAAVAANHDVFGDAVLQATGFNWFDLVFAIADKGLLPLGALGITLFVGWGIKPHILKDAIATGSSIGSRRWFFRGWYLVVRYLVPGAIGVILLHGIGVV